MMAKLSAYDRYQILMKAAQKIEARQEEFAKTITLEGGKVITEARVEAGRAVQDALPLLAMSGAVTVLLVDPEEDADIEAAEDLVAHLARHGLRAKTQVIRHQLATSLVADTLLAQIARLDADLLIMGAYGHSRLREMILGGVTRDILRNMNVPVLMSH